MQYLAQHAEVSDQQWGSTTVEMDAVMGAVHADGLSRFDPDVDVLNYT